jgi:hypothetical protein
VIQSVLAAAPKLQLHLFKSSTNQQLFSSPTDADRPINEHSLAKYWGWIDEVGWHNRRHAANTACLCALLHIVSAVVRECPVVQNEQGYCGAACVGTAGDSSSRWLRLRAGVASNIANAEDPGGSSTSSNNIRMLFRPLSMVVLPCKSLGTSVLWQAAPFHCVLLLLCCAV